MVRYNQPSQRQSMKTTSLFRMRPQDIVIGNYYRLKSSPNYGFAKALRVLKGKEDVNIHTYSIVKCEHTIVKDEPFGLIRYFRPCDMIKES